MKYQSSIQQVRKLLEESVKSDRDKIFLDYYSTEYKRHVRELDFLNSFPGSKVLEIGAAPYHFTSLCKLEDIKITSLDIAPDLDDHLVKTLQLEVVQCNIETEKIPFESDSFDIVMFNEVFEHLRINPIATLKEINRIIKKGGILYLTTPNLYMVRNIYRFVTGKGLDDPYYEFNKLNEVGYMGHVREYTVGQVAKFLSNTGYSIVSTAYHNYDVRKYLQPVYYLIPFVRTNICVVAKKA
jgi:SAM-dependent methyltransferase